MLILIGDIPVIGAIRTVTNLNDSGAGSLRDTMVVATSGDTINFAVTGTILLTGGELNNQGKNLTITGPGVDLLTVTQNSIPGFRIFKLDGTVSIFGITISNGSVRSGPTCSQPCYGGGVYNAGNLTLTACVITGNDANLDGGGIFNDGTLTLADCTIENNRAGDGSSSIIGFGGGLFNNGNATVRRCLFKSNHSDNNGAAIFNEDTLTLENSTLYSNTGGSAIDNRGSATITGCTVSRNPAPIGCGGGICNVGAVTLRNTILHDNDPYNVFSSASGTFTSSGYNLSSDDANGLLMATGDQINVDPQLDPYGLRYHGGYNQTIALISGSPAIDKGKSFGLANDQRGHPRPVDNPFVASAAGGDGSDIGAYESPSDPIQSSTFLIVTTPDDHDDGICGGLDCTLREAIQQANTLPGSNTIILDGSLMPTIALQTRILGELVVQGSTGIIGPGARVLALSSDGYNRIFSFLAGSSTVSGLTIRDGTSASSSPGGLALGGGIYNQTTLTLNDCTIAENDVLGGGASSPGSTGGSGLGGGIYNVGSLALNRCAFIHNGAFGSFGAPNPNQFGFGGAGGAGRGSAIFNGSGGALAVNLCTFFNNIANGGAGANGGSFGGNGGPGEGTIFNQGAMTLTASSLRGNYGLGGSRGLGNSLVNHGVFGPGKGGLVAGASDIVRNTICATNIASGFSVSFDVHGAFVSGGYNLIGKTNNSTGFTESTDQTGDNVTPLNPILGPMQNNGGPTDTMALLYGSPAIDRGASFGLLTDQRSLTRAVDTFFANAVGGDGADIGAVEMNLRGGPDSDGDGMSDDFERFFGVNDPNADPDADGKTNLQEFNAGSNPLLEELLITAVAVNGINVNVTFQTAVMGNYYRLERKDAILDAWGSIPGLADLTAQSTGTAQITDPGGATAGKHFYRIRRLP